MCGISNFVYCGLETIGCQFLTLKEESKVSMGGERVCVGGGGVEDSRDGG